MRKIITLFVSLLFVGSLAACNDGKSNLPTSAPSTQATTEAPQTSTEPPTSSVPSYDTPDVSTPPSDDQIDQVFVSVIRQNVPSAANAPTATIISEGHNVCQAFDEGATFTQIVDAFARNSGFPISESAYFIGASVGAYCDEYLGDLHE